MTKKTVSFSKSGIATLPNDKPVVYKIETASGANNYTGTAPKGHVQDRLEGHLAEGKIPGTRVTIETTSSVSEAKARERTIIARMQPKFNKDAR